MEVEGLVDCAKVVDGGFEAKMVADSVSSVSGAGATVVVLLNPVVPALSSNNGAVSTLPSY